MEQPGGATESHYMKSSRKLAADLRLLISSSCATLLHEIRGSRPQNHWKNYQNMSPRRQHTSCSSSPLNARCDAITTSNHRGSQTNQDELTALTSEVKVAGLSTFNRLSLILWLCCTELRWSLWVCVCLFLQLLLLLMLMRWNSDQAPETEADW